MQSETPVLPSLEHRVVVITGANRGLGRALAHAFDSAAAQLVLHARTEASLAPVIAGCSETPRVVIGDLRDLTLAARLTEAAVSLGGVDLLVLNGAMLGTMGPLGEASLTEFAEVMAVNVNAQLPLVQSSLPGMKRRGGGVIIWLSSGLGRFGLPGYGAYCASKHAIEGLMKVVAEEHTADGIISVAVAPGMVATEMLKVALGTDDVSEHQSPEETATAFVAMAQALAPSHSGESLDIAPWLA